MRGRGRLRLLEEYYSLDREFRVAVNSLAKKIRDKKIVSETALGEFDGLVLDAEARLLAEAEEKQRQRLIEREKQLLKIRKDFNP